MKTLRFFTLALLVILVFSSWAPAYAMPTTSSAPTSIELAKGKKLARLRVTNKTGGALYINLQSKTRSYNFSTGKQGKTTFDPVIEPGKYKITVRSSGCGGQLTYKRTVKGGTVGLPAFICRKK